MIIWFGDEAPAAEVGGKGRALSRLTAGGLPVPPGFCVGVSALAALDQFEPQVMAAVARLAAPALAVRSSAIGEDGAAASFAGIHASLLNVSPAALPAALALVRASADSPAAHAYRARRGITGPPRMAAVVQQMIDPDVSGVAFTRDPRSGAERFVVEATWGLGEALVAGLVTPDHWELDSRGALLSEQVAHKDLAVVVDGSGTLEVEVPPERRSAASLSRPALAAVVELARRCEQLFGAAQDVEWAIAGDSLCVLQSRPITVGGSRGPLQPSRTL